MLTPNVSVKSTIQKPCYCASTNYIYKNTTTVYSMSFSSLHIYTHTHTHTHTKSGTLCESENNYYAHTHTHTHTHTTDSGHTQTTLQNALTKKQRMNDFKQQTNMLGLLYALT